jgi:hypothetical protein
MAVSFAKGIVLNTVLSAQETIIQLQNKGFLGKVRLLGAEDRCGGLADITPQAWAVLRRGGAIVGSADALLVQSVGGDVVGRCLP